MHLEREKVSIYVTEDINKIIKRSADTSEITFCRINLRLA